VIKISKEVVRRALLNARWALTDVRIADEVRTRGTLPEGYLTEDEIARVAVAMVADSAARKAAED
jgi:hypothetical protein